MIRMLVPYSRTLYYNDKGRERGLTAELARDLERHINQQYKQELGKRPFTVFLFPTTRDKLISGVVDGRGDIAAGNITVTPERLKLVDFVAPEDQKRQSEVIVTGPKAPPINTVDDLSGKTIHVRPARSYYQSVLALNERLKMEGKAPVKIVDLPDALEDEDKLEMVNAGLLEIVVVDDWIAKMWAQILPNIKVHDNIALRTEGKVGWVIRKNSPELDAALNDFRNFAKKQGVIAYRRNRSSTRTPGAIWASSVSCRSCPRPARNPGSAISASRSSMCTPGQSTWTS